MPRQDTIFDVDDSATGNLAFQGALPPLSRDALGVRAGRLTSSAQTSAPGRSSPTSRSAASRPTAPRRRRPPHMCAQARTCTAQSSAWAARSTARQRAAASSTSTSVRPRRSLEPSSLSLTSNPSARADSSWFDVNTAKVLERCYKTLLPREDYVGEVLEGAPDLYGEPSFSSSSSPSTPADALSRNRAVLGADDPRLLAVPHLVAVHFDRGLPRRRRVQLRLYPARRSHVGRVRPSPSLSSLAL